MTLATQSDSALFLLEPAPMSGRVDDLVGWCDRNFQRLAGFLRQPEFPIVLHTVTDVVLDPATKVEPGLVLYGAAGVFGPSEGLYLREGATWKKLLT